MSEIPASVSRAVFDRDNNQCVVCGTHRGLQLHHWREFRSACGADTEDNLVTVCWHCHRAATEHEIEIELVRTAEGRLVAFIKGRVRRWQ